MNDCTCRTQDERRRNNAVGFIFRLQKEDWVDLLFCFVAFYLDASRIREHHHPCLEKMVLVSRRDSCPYVRCAFSDLRRPLLPVFPSRPPGCRSGGPSNVNLRTSAGDICHHTITDFLFNFDLIQLLPIASIHELALSCQV